jgi:hypothetical protein
MMIVADAPHKTSTESADFYQSINTKIHVNDSITVASNVQLLNNKVANDINFLIKSKVLLDSLSKWNKLPFTKNIKRCDSLRAILFELLDDELQSDDSFIASIDNVMFTDKLLQSDFEN